MKLFMVMLGCNLKGRHTEQHDIFFGIEESLSSLKEQMNAFWKEANGRLHADVWREVTQVDGYAIEVVEKQAVINQKEKLFFINLGGYKENEFEEYHYKMLTVATDKSAAMRQSRETAFYKHCGFKGAVSHVDNKYGIDVDDMYEIDDILSSETKKKYGLNITPVTETGQDELHIGYLKFDNID